MGKYYLILCVVLLCVKLNAQKYDMLKCDFSVMEKFVDDSISSTLITGTLNFDVRDKESIFNISFPKNEKWIMKDSTVYIEKQDTSYSIKVVNDFNIQVLFEEIFSSEENYFGLLKNGFSISEIDRLGNSIFITWKPPATFGEFLNKIIIEKKGKLTTGMIMIDVDGIAINSTYYENYIFHGELAIPQIIKSIFITTSGKKLYKKTLLRNVEIL